MLKTSFTLISKKILTHDVFELIYDCPDLLREPPKPGQYVMFQLAPGLNRSYSIALYEARRFTLIIKRIPDGKWSPIICDAEVGSVLNGMIPLGHFILQYTPRSKCFIGTGTGFAPLYCQLLGSKSIWIDQSSLAFIFGVRSFIDAFYEDEIQELGKYFENFEYYQYFSRESDFQKSEPKKLQGYVTDWITQENISKYEEFYLCGSPAMVKSGREKLEALGIQKENIFWEQF